MKRLIDPMCIDFDQIDISGCTDVDDIIFIIENLIDSQPTVNAVEVVHGEWTTIEDDYTGMTALECSECGEQWWFEDDPPIAHYHYCPNCGSKMNGEVSHGDR